MHGLDYVNKPYLTIFTRKDGLDEDDAPLHFCILRIFDLAFLYTLPHVDGRMLFTSSYTKNINTEALLFFNLNKKWVWESYDSTEERNPHAGFNVSKTIAESFFPFKGNDLSKLRIEKKPENCVEFKDPIISDKDIAKHSIMEMHCYYSFEEKEITQIVGSVSTECLFDFSTRCPLVLALNIKYENVVKQCTVVTLTYYICFSPNVYKDQFEYSGDEIAVNQNLIVKALELSLDCLLKDISQQVQNMPFTRKHLSFQSVRELLADMEIDFIDDELYINSVRGKDLWHSGYQ